MFGKDNTDGRLYVREVPPDMAAFKAGMKEGDELVAIDGAPVRTMSPDEVHRALAGRVGTRVKLSVHRGGETLDLQVERGPLRE